MHAGLCWKNELLPLAQRFADRIAVFDADGRASYREIFDHAAGVAMHLSHNGVTHGQPVATYFRNSRRAVAASYGTLLAGACEAPINGHLAPDDMQHCIETAGAKILLTDQRGAERLAGSDAQVTLVENLPLVPLAELPPQIVDARHWARIVFTSGTTGRSKGVVHSQIGRWTANLLLRATLPIAPNGRNVLVLTPFSHGASLMTYAFLDGGGSVTLLDGLNVAEVRQHLEAGAIDQIFAPPTVLAKLVPALEGHRVQGIEAIFCGTAPLSPELYARTRAAFGPVVRLTYGKSEVFNPITVLTPEETDAWYAEGKADTVCVGWPASGVEIAIAEAEAQPEGGPATGPVLLRTRHMLIGTLTGTGFEPHDPEVFHRTGDIGFVDEQGRLHLCGREADVMKTGGYRVTPEEIEAKLRPALASGEIVAFGMPSTYWGETITVAAAGAPDGWEQVLQPAIKTMTAFKRPKLFATLNELPRNAIGKISRAAVRKAVLERYDLEDGARPVLRLRDGNAQATSTGGIRK